MKITQNLFTVLATACASVGCANPYLKAVTTYADTADKGTSSLGEVSDHLASTCRQRSVAHYIKRRLQAPEAMSGNRWESYFALPNEADGTLSWQDYCASIQHTGENYSKLVNLLSAYTKAMKSLANDESWDGSALTDLVKNLSDLSGASTQAGQVLAALAPSAKQVGSFIVASYTEKQAHEFAANADAPVQAILDGLNTYLTKTIKDVVDPAATERAEAIDMVEKASVWTPPVDGARIISFTQYAQAADQEISDTKAKFADYGALISKLKAGQHVLATARADKPSVKDILTAATNILAALNGVRGALAPKPSN
jgi:hypothetical protein